MVEDAGASGGISMNEESLAVDNAGMRGGSKGAKCG